MAETLNIEGTRLLEVTLTTGAKVLVHEGGTSSSKTFSIAQAFLILSFREHGKTYSIVRKTMPALRRGALKDFRDALAISGCQSAFLENKTDFAYTNRQTGTRIEFFALDNAQKARGPRRDRLWCNEANELTYEDFRQLSMRTRGQIVIDYNPSMQRHWIYEHVLTRDDCTAVHSTFRDNPFLSADNVREIEVDVPVYQEADGELVYDWDLTYRGRGALIAGDVYRWAVFGLGLRGAPTEAIYPALHETRVLPPDTVLGLDFGFNHPTVLLRVGRIDRPPKPELHFDELVHASYLTTPELMAAMAEAGVGKGEKIYADGSRPETIEEMRRAGWNVHAADKTAGSVKSGIDFLKSHRLCFTKRSERSKGQFADYRWKKLPDGTVTDEPVKLNDDGPDAGRYAAYTHWHTPKSKASIQTAAPRSSYAVQISDFVNG